MKSKWIMSRYPLAALAIIAAAIVVVMFFLRPMLDRVSFEIKAVVNVEKSVDTVYVAENSIVGKVVGMLSDKPVVALPDSVMKKRARASLSKGAQSTTNPSWQSSEDVAVEQEKPSEWHAKYNGIEGWTDMGKQDAPHVRERELNVSTKIHSTDASDKANSSATSNVVILVSPDGKTSGTKLAQNASAPKITAQNTAKTSETTKSSSTPEETKITTYEKISVQEMFAESKKARTGKFDYHTRTVSGFEMVRVEGGTFTMGATAEQAQYASDDESPTHQVTLKSFLMARFEVTQKQWSELMEDNPSRNIGPNYPVDAVSYDQVMTYIGRLNERTGMKFRLPTEAEWEYAARGGKYARACIYSGSDLPEEVAWYSKNSSRKTHPVGRLAPNELGLYDMSGNVKEWCSDSYTIYSSVAQNNPNFSNTSALGLLRGGSCSSDMLGCRVSVRYVCAAQSTYYFTGFRLACDE